MTQLAKGTGITRDDLCRAKSTFASLGMTLTEAISVFPRKSVMGGAMAPRLVPTLQSKKDCKRMKRRG